MGRTVLVQATPNLPVPAGARQGVRPSSGSSTLMSYSPMWRNAFQDRALSVAGRSHLRPASGRGPNLAAGIDGVPVPRVPVLSPNRDSDPGRRSR